MVTKSYKYNHTAEAFYTLYLSLSAKAQKKVKEMINADRDQEDEQFMLMGEDVFSKEWNEPENNVWDSFFEEKFKNV